MKPVLVNLGCGSRYHTEWLNFDIHSLSPDVRTCNLVEGIPLPDDSCDAVYNAALLEHLPSRQAENFLGECHRILKPGGILRVGVPDLEQIVRIYLAKLADAVEGKPSARADYEWILLELLDQMTRTRSGGAMLEAIQKRAVNEPFVVERIGNECRMLVASLAGPRGRWARFQAMPAREARHRVWRAMRESPRALRRSLALLALSSSDGLALREGLFRASGEVHRWMYDRFSLVCLLDACGFRDASVQPFSASRIAPDWPRYGLDADEQGRPLKPDLLFVEAVK